LVRAWARVFVTQLWSREYWFGTKLRQIMVDLSENRQNLHAMMTRSALLQRIGHRHQLKLPN
jgi:hypothetical protein